MITSRVRAMATSGYPRHHGFRALCASRAASHLPAFRSSVEFVTRAAVNPQVTALLTGISGDIA
jgi:hypothetical protein